MRSVTCLLIYAIWAVSLCWSVAQNPPIATIELLTNSATFTTPADRPKPGADSALCLKVCSNIRRCMATADVARSGLETLPFLIVSTVSPATCFSLAAQVSPPTSQPTSPSQDPGTFVVSSQAASFTINDARLTTFFTSKFYQGTIVEGSINAQCDGLSWYFSPGGNCSCQADFKVTSGSFMGVSAPLTADLYVPDAPLKVLGVINVTRVKQNLSPDDFWHCNKTIMGAHDEYDDGKPFPVQCFRNLIVQETRVSRYNQAYCGTQYMFFNMGKEDRQDNTTNCRDGVGVVTFNSTKPDDPYRTPWIKSPAGVFYHRNYKTVDTFPGPDAETTDDPHWFFTLTPAQLPLNKSTVLDMELTMLSGIDANRTQVTCIAEITVSPYFNETGRFSGQILGHEPVVNPDAAGHLVISAVLLLLPALLCLL